MIWDKETFERNFAEMLKNGKPIVVDFYADWCGPCRTIEPVIDALAKERSDVIFGKVNVDESPEIAARYGIMSIPTVILFRNGQPVDNVIGANVPRLTQMVRSAR